MLGVVTFVNVQVIAAVVPFDSKKKTANNKAHPLDGEA
jgi:hypothetical protein